MDRPSAWVLIVVLLLSVLFLREPRFQRGEEIFLKWLLHNSTPPRAVAPLTIVEIGGEPVLKKGAARSDPAEKLLRGSAGANNSLLDAALFVQAALEFRPSVVAFESILKWGDREKDAEQIFLDQALRVPKLLVGAELTMTPDPDAPVPEIPAFTQVKGKRSDLIEFSGISRQPDEDVRLIGTLGFVNLPEEIASDIHVPLLLQYRGEVIPSFALQTALLWMRVPLNEVKIELGSFIRLPNGTRIPIRSDGTLLVNPGVAGCLRHITLNELLLAAQQRESHAATAGSIQLDDIQDQVVLARAASSSPSEDPFAAAIAAIQSRSFLRRISWLYDCAAVLVAAAVSGTLRRFSRVVLVLGALAFSAAYCLAALAIVSRWSIWIPGLLPLGAIWISVLFAIILPKPKDSPRPAAIVAPPPTP
jgi:hypothetical protein